LTLLVQRGRKLLDRIDSTGTTCWDTMADWRRGASTASYDPEHGGNRWEADDEGEVWPVPSDPTGDTALGPPDDQALGRYRRNLTTLASIIDHLEDDLNAGTPHRPGRLPDKDRLAEQAADDGYCKSCYRAGKMVEQATHKDGTARFKGFCRWCHDFKQEYGQLPPGRLLNKRHAGGRITEQDITRALGRKSA
jgi:hypothetical protein